MLTDKKKTNFSFENDDIFIKNNKKKEKDIKIEKNEKENEILSSKSDGEKNKNEQKMDNNLENFREMFIAEINTEIKKVKTKKLTTKNNKEYYKLLSMKLIKSLNKLLEAFNQISKNKITNINNINNTPVISTINAYLKLPNPINLEKGISKSSLVTVDNSFSSDKLSISSIASFNFQPSYDNINEISNGEYIINKSLQDQTQKFIKSFKNNITKINCSKNYVSDYPNINARKKSFSVKTIKSDISRSVNIDILKQKNIIKEISTPKKINNKSYIKLNKFTQNSNLTQENKTLNRLQTTDEKKNIKLKVSLFDKNSLGEQKREDQEIEYKFSNKIIKGKYSRISEILNRTKNPEKKIDGKINNILAEFNNLQKRDNTKIDDKSIDNMIKHNKEKNNNLTKEVDVIRESNNNIQGKKSCNVY